MQCLVLFDLLQSVVFANCTDDTARTKMTTKKSIKHVREIESATEVENERLIFCFVFVLTIKYSLKSNLNMRELWTVIDFNTNIKNIIISTKTQPKMLNGLFLLNSR